MLKAKIKKLLNAIYISLGFIAFAVGCIGIVLPILPTVPFFLLTSFFFAKGSKRFEKLFTSSKIYKKYAAGFMEHKAMSFIGEITLLVFISAVVISVCLIFDGSLVIAVIMPVLESVRYSYFFLCVKTLSASEMKSLNKI